MFRHLIVPLDGSPFAEQALPLALAIARRAGADLELVRNHVLYALNDYPSQWAPFDPVMEAECRLQEQTYLDATARWVASGAPVKVTGTLVSGLVADGLLAHIRAQRADLVVMTTHGRGPASRFFVGSVADFLVRNLTEPVLLLRPHEKPPPLIPSPLVENVLIPLDGSPLAERVLEPAVNLALLMEARCTLLRVIESRPAHARPVEEEEAYNYLEPVARRLREQIPQVQTRVVVAPHAPTAILKEAVCQGCDLIALATHGRGGVRRLLLGSVADKVIRGTLLPVLVYRPSEG